MNKPKFQKGKSLAVVKTLGREKGQYDLYDLVGLSLGKLEVIKAALEGCFDNGNVRHPLADELLAVINKNLDYQQTIEGL